MAILYGESGTAKLLVLSQVILSLQLPFAIIPLVRFTSDKAKMGSFANAMWMKVAAWGISTLIIALNLELLWGLLPGLGGLRSQDDWPRRRYLATTDIAKSVFRCYRMPVDISFHPAKRAGNKAKHGLDLADAGSVLAGVCVERLDTRFDYGEDRWISLGLLCGEVVVCVWADWHDVARVISLRKAMGNEQRYYFREVGA